MRKRTPALLPMLALLAAAPLSAHAQTPCAGFSDVFTTDPFCASVAWIKNRNVTAGCTPSTYCGGDLVSRLQMAAFMFRVANVVTPTVLDVEAAGGAISPLSAPTVLCQTADVPAVGYDRIATATADLSYSLTGQQDLVLRIATSPDGGATWQSLSSTSPSVSGSAGTRQHASLTTNTLPHPIAATNHPAGETQRYGVYLVRGIFNLNQSISDWTCHLQVFLRTRAQ